MDKIKVVLKDKIRLHNIDSFFLGPKKFFSEKQKEYINLFYNRSEDELEEEIVNLLFRNGTTQLVPLKEISTVVLIEEEGRVINLKGKDLKYYLITKRFKSDFNYN